MDDALVTGACRNSWEIPHCLQDKIQCWCGKHLALSSWVSPPPPAPPQQVFCRTAPHSWQFSIILLLSIPCHKLCPLLGTGFLPFPPGLFHSPFHKQLGASPGGARRLCSCPVSPGWLCSHLLPSCRSGLSLASISNI